MRTIIEAYSIIFVIMLMFYIGLAFSCIAMHVNQAKLIYNSVRAEIQSSNGEYIIEKLTKDGSFKDADGNAVTPAADGNIPADTRIHLVSGNSTKTFYTDGIKDKDGKDKKVTGYGYDIYVTRESILYDEINADDATFRYSDVYKIELSYKYSVPLFWDQVYPLVGFVA